MGIFQCLIPKFLRVKKQKRKNESLKSPQSHQSESTSMEQSLPSPNNEFDCGKFDVGKFVEEREEKVTEEYDDVNGEKIVNESTIIQDEIENVDVANNHLKDEIEPEIAEVREPVLNDNQIDETGDMKEIGFDDKQENVTLKVNENSTVGEVSQPETNQDEQTNVLQEENVITSGKIDKGPGYDYLDTEHVHAVSELKEWLVEFGRGHKQYQEKTSLGLLDDSQNKTRPKMKRLSQEMFGMFTSDKEMRNEENRNKNEASLKQKAETPRPDKLNDEKFQTFMDPIEKRSSLSLDFVEANKIHDEEAATVDTN